MTRPLSDNVEVVLYDYHAMLLRGEQCADVDSYTGTAVEMIAKFNEIHEQLAFDDDVFGVQRRSDRGYFKSYRYFSGYSRTKPLYLLELIDRYGYER
jgi:hypothetical protein